MIDVMFCFSDEYLYSSSLANWNSINAGQEIEIVDDNQTYSIVRNDIINYNKKILFHSEQEIKIPIDSKHTILDGDTINCYIDTYYLAVVEEIIDGGSEFQQNEVIFINENSYFDTCTDRNQKASLRIKSIDEKGSIKELEVLDNGKFVRSFNEIEIQNQNGKIAKIKIILVKNKEKTLKILSVLNVEQKDNYLFIKINETIKDKFIEAQVTLKRHRLTLNKKINKDYNAHLFFVKVEKTPFLNLPLAKDNNIEKAYNQAILTLDSKIEKLSRTIE
jgi:hypothetical protein